jgi:hypothetical protein
VAVQGGCAIPRPLPRPTDRLDLVRDVWDS